MAAAVRRQRQETDIHVGENLRRTFTEWLLHSSHPERIPAPRANGQAPGDRAAPEAHGWAVDALLYQLWWLRTGERFACSSYAQAVAGVCRLEGPTFAELYGRISDYLADRDQARETAADASRPRLAS